jgi:DNA uptake protein ComE-like DNA-binding protein
MLDRIAEAERRATSAEERARAVVDEVAAPMPELDPREIFDEPSEPASAAEPASPPEPEPTPEAETTSELEPSPEPEPTPQPEPAPEPEATPEPEPAPEPEPEQPAPAASAPSGGGVSLNSASYDQLRELGLSVTQTGRVLSHRERTGGFKSLDELDQIPGFPRTFLDDLKTRISL